MKKKDPHTALELKNINILHPSSFILPQVGVSNPTVFSFHTSYFTLYTSDDEYILKSKREAKS